MVGRALVMIVPSIALAMPAIPKEMIMLQNRQLRIVVLSSLATALVFSMVAVGFGDSCCNSVELDGSCFGGCPSLRSSEHSIGTQIGALSCQCEIDRPFQW
jgi:hypothetical protein